MQPTENLKYLGIVSSISPKSNSLILTDIPLDFPSINKEIPAFIGYSKSFLKEIRLNNISNNGNTISISLTKLQNNLAQFVRMAVFVEEAQISKELKDVILPEDLLDCKVYDQDNKLIGNVVDVHIIPNQLILITENTDYSVPLPFNEDILIKYHKKKKSIQIELPEGIMELAEYKKKARK